MLDSPRRVTGEASRRAGADVVLRVRGVHKGFGAVQVLRGVDLELPRGQILGLVGENGAGKSTLVQCIARTSAADRGTIELAMGVADADADGHAQAALAVEGGLAVVWQDLALCDNLTAVANLFLGHERADGVLLDEFTMAREAQALFDQLRISIGDLDRPVSALSGGQRQMLAIARAILHHPTVLILDEPTAALGMTESAVVERMLAELRDADVSVLLVSHRLDQVFRLVDRIAVLRGGRIVAEVSPLEVHPDDVIAMVSGIEVDSTARRQLRRLRSLVDQLAEVEPAASLPLIVSAMAEALGTDQLCLHLLDQPDDATEPRLRRSAAIGLSDSFLAGLESLPLGSDGGPPGVAAERGEPVTVEDVRHDPWWRGIPNRRRDAVRSAWSVPIVGSVGVLGTISGFADTVGRPQTDHLELVSLYASHAAAAIERERLLADATRRNRLLETLRGVLDTLAGPQPAGSGLALALVALGRGLGADAIALYDAKGELSEFEVSTLGDSAGQVATAVQRAAAEAVLDAPRGLDRARPVGENVLAVPIEAPEGRAVVTVWWSDPARLSNDALDLLDDAARSLSLALEREVFEQANAETASLRRSNRLQQEFLSRLNHELRTPLTAIQGFASTLRQPDVSWDESSQQRFLDSIASESARMGRLVGDLLDFSAIDSGVLRLLPDWCDVGLVMDAARVCVADAPADLFVLEAPADLPAIWADHDRLEQVFVNLFENAVRHGVGLSRVLVTATVGADRSTVVVRVCDDGIGIDPRAAPWVFLPQERASASGAGAGLGLAIARGIVQAHGGSIALEPSSVGTTVVVVLPIEPDGSLDGTAGPEGAAPVPTEAR